MGTMRAALAGVLLVAVAVCPLAAFALRPETLAAFERYARLTEARLDEQHKGRRPFMWMDSLAERDKAKAYERLRAGEVVVAKLETRDGTRKIDAPDGLIHHWIGTVLFSGVNMERALAFVQDFGRYADHFKPMMRQSKLKHREGDAFDTWVQLYTKKVVTVVLNVDHHVEYGKYDDNHVFSMSRSTRIAEVDGFGTPAEHEKPVDEGTGYLWRTNLYCNFEARPEGTYEQCESISLTRDIPFGFGWLIGPFVSGVPREAIEFTLGKARAALMK